MHFKDIRIITDNPDRFAHPIDIPVVQTVDESGINVPAGFRALLVTGGSKKPDDRMQYLAVTPSGSIYARTSRGIIALQRRSGDSHADAIEEFGSGGGTGIAVHDGSLYYSTDSTISRYQLTQGKLVPQGEPQVIVKGLPPEEGAVHPFAFDGEGRLLVEAGAVENAINPSAPPPQDLLQNYGGFWRFDANKPDQNFTDGFHYAKGVLHAPSVAWNPTAKTFFTITQGRERLDFAGVDAYDALDSAERPANELHRLDEGVDLGWPLTYYDAFKHARMVAPEFGGDNHKKADAGKCPDPLIAFPGHGAPMQMVFYTAKQFPQKYRGGAFVAFNGSRNTGQLPQTGCNVCFLPFDEKGMPTGACEVFADGFAVWAKC